MDYMSKAIPVNVDQKDWQQVKIIDSPQKLIPISQLDQQYVIECPKYHEWDLPKALKHCYVREEVGAKLVKAAKNLPLGYKFLIWDGFRPFEVQKSLFDKFYKDLEKGYPNHEKEKLMDMTTKFVSYPSLDESSPAPHLTGGAVDLTIIDNHGNPLQMGTDFDSFTKQSATRFYEQKSTDGNRLSQSEIEALQNRRLLYHVLIEVGFSNYPEEWWHFDYGNQWWATRTKRGHAVYGIASLDE